jgi:4-hydroxybenzoate polyprenyltransferase
VRGRWDLFLWFGLGAFATRSAGCVYNDIVDRDLDQRVERTRLRPLASGRVSLESAWLLIAGLCVLGLVVLLQLNVPAAIVSLISIAPVAAYPFMKRITWWPQAWLGLTFNWGALLGFAAQTGRLDIADGILYAGLFFWTLGYDTIYAHQDKEDDALIGVKSTARLLGEDSRKWILRFYAMSFTLILASGFAAHAGWPFGFVMLAAGAHFLWQVRRLNIDDPDNCLMLFRSNRTAGALIALAFACAAWFG